MMEVRPLPITVQYIYPHDRKALVSSVGFETGARQNETLRISKIRTGDVCSRCAGQFRGNLPGVFGLCHACAAALNKILLIYVLLQSYLLDYQLRPAPES